MVISNIQASYYTYKTQESECRKKPSFCQCNPKEPKKVVEMCDPPYIQAERGTQLSKLALSRQNQDVWDP
jgi:hypothetical protein